MKKHIIAALLLCLGASANAQPGHSRPAGPPVPSALDAAAIPGLTGDQQAGLRKVLLQQRDAVEALVTHQRADFDALRMKGRSERERIDDATATSLCKLLGDDGLRKFAEWQRSQRGMRGPGSGMHGGIAPE